MFVLRNSYSHHVKFTTFPPRTLCFLLCWTLITREKTINSEASGRNLYKEMLDGRKLVLCCSCLIKTTSFLLEVY